MLKTRKNQARYIPDNNSNVTDSNTERALPPLYKVVSQTSQQKSEKNSKMLLTEKVLWYILSKCPRETEFEVWLSLVERCVRDAEAASSNLVTSIWPCSQAVKTSPSHGEGPGSIPGKVT